MMTDDEQSTFDEHDLEKLIKRMEERIELKKMLQERTVSLDELSSRIQGIISENRMLKFPKTLPRT